MLQVTAQTESTRWLVIRLSVRFFCRQFGKYPWENNPALSAWKQKQITGLWIQRNVLTMMPDLLSLKKKSWGVQLRDKRTGWGAAELMFWSPRQLLPLLSFLTASLPFIPIVVAKLRCPRRPRGTVGECGRECRSQTDPQQNTTEG